MQRTVLYSQTVLWAGNNTHTHTNVPVCCSSMTSSLPPIGFMLHLRLHLLRCFHISWQCLFEPPLPQNHFMSACRHFSLCLCWTCIFFTGIYLSESSQYDSAGLEFTSHHLENPLVLALCCLLLLTFIFPSPLILHNQQHCIPLYRKKKTTNQSLFVLCLELYSHFSLEAQTGLCPAGFKEAEMAADVGTLTKPRLSSALHRCPVNFSPWHPFTDAHDDKWQVLMEWINGRARRPRKINVLWSHTVQTHTHTHAHN